MRPLAWVLVVAALTGCGSSPEDERADYCEVVTEQQVALSEALAEESPDALLGALPLFRELAAEAPPDIDDDWTVFVGALEGLQEALDAAGADATSYDAKSPPPDVTQEEQAAIARAADELATPEVSNAFEAVKQQAKDVCKTPLYQ